VNGRSRSSVTADRKVELTAAVSLAATTGGLFFLADEGQNEGAAVRRGAVPEQEDALANWLVRRTFSNSICTERVGQSRLRRRFYDGATGRGGWLICRCPDLYGPHRLNHGPQRGEIDPQLALPDEIDRIGESFCNRML
jgi:hypothetical protein